jgi:hypothetical protein
MKTVRPEMQQPGKGNEIRKRAEQETSDDRGGITGPKLTEPLYPWDIFISSSAVGLL